MFRVLWAKGTSRLLPVQSLSLWWYGGVLVPTALVTCTYVKELLLLKGIYRFLSNICCPPEHIFLGTSLPILARPQSHLACVTLVWLHSKRVCVLDWSLCSLDLWTVHYKAQNTTTETPDCWANYISKTNRKESHF